jgi:hypothetical protein
VTARVFALAAGFERFLGGARRAPLFVRRAGFAAAAAAPRS